MQLVGLEIGWQIRPILTRKTDPLRKRFEHAELPGS